MANNGYAEWRKNKAKQVSEGYREYALKRRAQEYPRLYNDWIGRVNASRDKYIEDAKSRADVYQPSNLFNSYADTTDAEIRALAAEGQKYREHFQKYGDLYGADMANKIRSGVDDVDSYLHDLSVGLGAERRYWEGFTDLEDFNTKRAAAEAAKKEAEEYAANKEKYKAYDFAAGEEKATYLKGIAERLADIASKERGDGNTLVGGGLPTFRERRETADREREVVYQELRSRYPELADYDLTELNNYIAQLGDEIEGGKSFLELDKFSNYGNPRSEYYDPNFEQYAKYDPSRLDRISYLNDGFNESYDPYAIAYHYINSSEDVKHDIMNRYANANGGDTNINVIQMRDWLVDLNNMSEEQKKNFNYLYSYTPRYAIPRSGEKRRVERYTEYILPEIENIAEYKFGQAHPFLASLLSMAYTPLSGVEVVADTAKYLGNVLIDPNNAKIDSNSFAEDKGILGQGVSDTVDWNIGGWDAFDFIYNTGMSGVDSAVASFIPGGYMLLGLSEAANGVNDGLERGMSDGQALANGVFRGIFEALFEKISIGNLDSMKSLKPKTLKQFGKEMVKSMGVNASEEALTELANITYDIIANGELSQLQQLVGSGKSYLEAIGELGLQVLESGASGALMGMGFSGAASGVNAAVNTFKQNKIGKGIVADGKAQDYISRGLELPDTKAFKYAEAAKAKLDKGKSANVRIGKLAQNLSDSQMISSFRSQLGEKSGDIAETLTDLVKGREVSNKAIRSILQNETALSMLNESFGTSFTADSKVEDVNEGIKKGFETPKTERDKIVDTLKKNVDSKGVNAYADTIEALQRGEVVSDKEINAFLKNPQALAALNEITGEAFTKKSTTNTVRKAMVKDNMSRPGQALMFGTTLDIGENGLKGLVSVANHSSGSMANIAQAYNAIYQAAKQGKAITDAKNPYLAELNAAQKLIAYEYGVMDSLEKKAEEEKVSPEFLDEAKVKAAQSKVDEAKTTEGAKKKGSVIYSGDRGKLSDLQKKSLEVLEKISTSLGVTFHMYESKKVNGRFVYKMPNGVVKSANGWYDTKTGEIWLDINAGLNGEGKIIFTAAHELTHFIKQWSPTKFKIFADFLVEQYNERGFSVDSLVQDQIDKAKRNGEDIDPDTAYEEVIADSCETFLRDSNAAEKIAALNEKDAGLAQKIKQFISNLLKRLRELMSGMKPDSFEGNLVSEMTASIEQLHKLWADALADAGEAYSTLANIDFNTEKEHKDNSDVKYSVREIVGDSGKNYGVGVYLDSTLLTDLTEDERIEMVKERIKELGGSAFTAYDSNHNAVDVHIVESTRRFKNKNGRRVRVYEHMLGYLQNEVKQEALVLVDELISTSVYDRDEQAAYPHDWLDNNGANNWESWTTYIQDKENTVWEATLKIANSTTGEKILYEVYPIKMVEQSGKPNTSTTAPIITHPDGVVNSNTQKNSLRNVEPIETADYVKMYHHFGSTKNYDVAGYILGNGIMLDFSGKHWGDDYSTSRQVDHRDIQEVLGNRGSNNGVDAMIDMIGNGNIRLMPEVGGINLAVKPNATQMSQLRGYINHFRGEVEIDIDAVGGDTIHSFSYTRGTSSSKILADIKAYFDEGIVPEKKAENETDIHQFLFSERDPDALTNREILANMLDSVAESDRDKAFLDKYKARLAQIDEDTAEIARLKEEKKGAEKLRREVIASKIEKLENGITESEKWLKNLEDTATLKRLVNKERDAMYAEAVLAGQMAQGKADAKVIRKQQEKLDKEKQKRADMRSDMQQRAKESKSEVVARERQKRADMQQKAKESKAEAVAREKQKKADMLAEYRARVAEREQRIKEKYQEARERSIEGRNKTEIRNKIKGVVSMLHKLLTSDSKEKHVPSGLRTVVADALSMINMDTVDAEKRIKIYNERIAKADDPVVKEALTHKRDEIEAKGVRFAEKIAKLQDAYAQIKKDSSADVRSVYSEDIEEYIKAVREQVGDTSIKDMDIDQLEA
ncbi:MAG: hypothetical protein U0M60_06505, partial [Clostridia bacterium]|nr:hypothetical protein [Clostridia bacterium]